MAKKKVVKKVIKRKVLKKKVPKDGAVKKTKKKAPSSSIKKTKKAQRNERATTQTRGSDNKGTRKIAFLFLESVSSIDGVCVRSLACVFLIPLQNYRHTGNATSLCISHVSVAVPPARCSLVISGFL